MKYVNLFFLILLLLFIGCSSKITSLEKAAESGDLQKVKLFIADSSQEQKRIALLNASQNSHLDIINFLLKNNSPVSGLTLWHAVMSGNPKAVKRILKEDIDIDEIIDQDGSTSLFEAVYRGNTEIVKILIDHGADTIKKLENGQTVLDIAKEKNYTEIIEYLTSHSSRPAFPTKAVPQGS